MERCLPFREPTIRIFPLAFLFLSGLIIQRIKIVTITKNLRFHDRFQFVSRSLDSRSKTLKTADFLLLKTIFSSTHPTVDCKLLTRKGHFSYSYLDSKPKFEKTSPNYGDDWKNTLTGKNDISDADNAQTFKIYTLYLIVATQAINMMCIYGQMF